MSKSMMSPLECLNVFIDVCIRGVPYRRHTRLCIIELYVSPSKALDSTSELHPAQVTKLLDHLFPGWRDSDYRIPDDVKEYVKELGERFSGMLVAAWGAPVTQQPSPYTPEEQAARRKAKRQAWNKKRAERRKRAIAEKKAARRTLKVVS